MTLVRAPFLPDLLSSFLLPFILFLLPPFPPSSSPPPSSSSLPPLPPFPPPSLLFLPSLLPSLPSSLRPSSSSLPSSLPLSSSLLPSPPYFLSPLFHLFSAITLPLFIIKPSAASPLPLLSSPRAGLLLSCVGVGGGGTPAVREEAAMLNGCRQQLKASASLLGRLHLEEGPVPQTPLRNSAELFKPDGS